MKLHFRKIGEGKPVIILHGLFGSSDNWQTFGKELGASGYAVYLVDLRNHGKSGHDDSMNYEVLLNDISELFIAEHLNGAAIIGHSLGGKTAMKFALRHPDKLNSLIVIDIAPRKYPVHHRLILDTLLAVDTQNKKTRKEIESELSAHIKDNSTLQFLMKNLYWKEPDRLDWRFNLHAINENIEITGSQINAEKPFEKPALFIRGENSDYISEPDEIEIKKLFKNADIKTAPASGHWVHADNPEWLLNEVKNFLQNSVQ